MVNVIRVATACSLLALGACGGHSSSSPATSSPAPSLVPAGSFLATASSGSGSQTGFAFNGNALSANGTDPTTQVTVGTDPSTGHRTLTLNVTANNAPLYTNKFDLAMASPAVVAPFIGVLDGTTFSDGSRANEIVVDPTLSFSSYGIWVNTTSLNMGNTGAFAVGQMTPAANIPTTGQAVYTGSTIGALVTGGGSFVLTGNAQLTANFLLMSVSGSLSGMQAFANGTSTPWNTLTLGAAPITAGAGGPYAGAVTSPASGSLVALSGTYNGNFFGPAANETAGTWKVTGTGTTAFGAFGAKR